MDKKRIYFESDDVALRRILDRDLTVSVIGIGTIGLPVATFLASQGFNVWGIDKNRDRIDQANSGIVAFEYSDDLKKNISSGLFRATDDYAKALKESDVAIVCVPTPLDDQRKINLSYLEDVMCKVAESGPSGMVVVVESSVCIGATKSMGEMVGKKTGLGMGKDFGLVYTPERYNPTLPTEKYPEIFYGKVTARDERKYTLDNIPRVMGGIDKKSILIAKTLYSQFIKDGIFEVSSIETAEAAKLLENIFRDVNIALVNEMALIMPKFGLDIYEVIEAAKTKPFSFMPHYPGLVGGECIPVDTWYLIRQGEDVGVDSKLMKAAREVNDHMALHAVDLLRDALAKFGKGLDGSKVCILGLAYKKNVSDSRVSLSNVIKESLESLGAIVTMCDPVVERMTLNAKVKLTPLSDAFEGTDGIILATDHDIFKNIDIETLGCKMRTHVVVDTKNFFDGAKLRSKGFQYRCFGKAVD
jgi:UDP-N-acetyl-D-glucosamine dehydrogenase